MGIGKNLKELLKEKNISIKELSELSGISVNTLYSITKRDPKVVNSETIEKIASALEIPPSYLRLYLAIDPDDIEQLHDENEKVNLFSKDIINDIENTIKRNKKHGWNSDLELDILRKTTIEAGEEQIRLLPQNSLLKHYQKLNTQGKRKVVDYAEDMANIPKYQAQPEEQKESLPDDQEGNDDTTE